VRCGNPISASPNAGDNGGTLCPRQAFNRHRRELRILRTRLGRPIRDIVRKIAGHQNIEAAFARPLGRDSQIRGRPLLL
jgi:IS5 family transposase